MVEVMDVLRFRRWEQSKKVNFGRLFAYISEVRELQQELQCGKVFPSSYLATYSKDKNKNYVLVIDMIKSVDSVYGNKPIVYAQLIVGRNQVIVRMVDLNVKNKNKEEVIFDSDTKVLKIAKGLIDIFKEKGINPVKTADYYFGRVMPRYQTSFDNMFELLSDEEIEKVGSILEQYDFEVSSSGCVKVLGEFTLSINNKNIYNDFIVSLIDNNDRSNIHWAIKDENLIAFTDEILDAYKDWKTRRKGLKNVES